MFGFLNKDESYKTVSSKEAQEILKDKNSILVDVREKDEYEKIKIPGSILIPLGEIKINISEKVKDLNTTIIVHCQSGVRSKKACIELSKLGYKNVYDAGGINTWTGKTQ
jgi:phage shock protein E